jgi:hypothetical protein
MRKFNIGPQNNLEPSTEWYDTPEGVHESIKTLEGFNKLISARHYAGYVLDKRLHEFRILNGNFLLDSAGNTMKKVSESGYKFESDVPKTDLKCPECNQGWTIENVLDTVVWNEQTKAISLEKFVGKSLKEVKKHFAGLTDAIYQLRNDYVIRNDKNIDLTPQYENPKNKYEKSQVLNEFGWIGEKENITEDYIVQEGDEAYFATWTFFHKDCNAKHLEKEYKEKYKVLFNEAGFNNIEITSVPNQYCSCDHCEPWYNVKTPQGNILIGWRKRVINIDWEGLVKPFPNAKETNKKIKNLFVKEDVTKGETYIHAWGWEKAAEYLTLINKQLN